jgi:hypothetical protein
MYNSAAQYRIRAVQVEGLCSLWAVGFKVRTNPPVVLQSVVIQTWLTGQFEGASCCESRKS